MAAAGAEASDAPGHPLHSSVRVKLKRMDRTYHPGEVLEGRVVVRAKAGWRHQGVRLGVTGQVVLHAPREDDGSAAVAGFFETLREVGREVLLEIPDAELGDCPASFPAGETRVPFALRLPAEGDGLLESLHGASVNVVYNIHVQIERGRLSRVLKASHEFLVELPPPPGQRTPAAPDLVEQSFRLTPPEAEGRGRGGGEPGGSYEISGKLHALHCSVTRPLTGEITVQESSRPVEAIDLLLQRIERVRKDGRMLEGVVDVQITQIAMGDVCRGLALPIYVVLPRLYVGPTIHREAFTVDFAATVIVTFADGREAVQRFPLTLYRP